MESGPSMMYMQQMPAFNARSALVTDLGPSTPETPPIFNPPNLEGLAALKKQIVGNLPKVCSHCGAELFPECFVELRDGTIMAYCKKRGACGRSLVLFAGVDLVKPVYRKICPFKKKEEFPISLDNDNTYHHQASQQMQQQAVPANILLELERMEQQMPLDIYALHGIPKPTDICELCNKMSEEHEHTQCDQYGWVHDHDELLPLPDDWLIFDPTTHTWSERRSLR